MKTKPNYDACRGMDVGPVATQPPTPQLYKKGELIPGQDDDGAEDGPPTARVTPKVDGRLESPKPRTGKGSWRLRRESRVPRTLRWLAKYSPVTYVAGLIDLAMTGESKNIPEGSMSHIRESDAELIGYIRLLNDHAGEGQRERFCAQLLEQQKARIGA